MGWLVRFSTSRIFALFLFAFRCLAAEHAADHPDDRSSSWNLTLDSGASDLILKCSAQCPMIADPRFGGRVLAGG